MRKIELTGFFTATWAFILMVPAENNPDYLWAVAVLSLITSILWGLDWYHERLKRKLAELEGESRP